MSMLRTMNAAQVAMRAAGAYSGGPASSVTIMRYTMPGAVYVGFSTIAKSAHTRKSGAAAGHQQQARGIETEAKKEEIRPNDRSQVHFRAKPNPHPLGMGSAKQTGKEWSMPHEIWTTDEVNSIQVTHKEPEEVVDHVALRGVRLLRFSFDLLAGFKTGVVDEHKYLNRVIFLETVAGIPGMVAGSLRHLSSLRRMRRFAEKAATANSAPGSGPVPSEAAAVDHGWIHTLLEEAENERMHLLTFLKLKQPGPIFRFCVMISQGLMYNAFFLAYIVSPKLCHRFVGYIEEEAVHTYTTLLKDLDDEKLPLFSNLPAPAIAKSYWKLPDGAMFRDLILAVRADEANHRIVNHTFADMHKEFKQDAVNPFSIQSNVSKYAEPQGTQTPEISEIVGGIQFSTDEQKKEAIEEAVKDAEDAAKKL